MNYRRLFVFALILNVALAVAVYWIWKSSKPATVAAPPAAEHPPMEGFTLNAPPEGAAPASSMHGDWAPKPPPRRRWSTATW